MRVWEENSHRRANDGINASALKALAAADLNFNLIYCNYARELGKEGGRVDGAKLARFLGLTLSKRPGNKFTAVDYALNLPFRFVDCTIL